MEPNVDEFGVEWRKCTKCGRYKELEAGFALNPRHTYGRSTQCRECCNERERKRRREEKETRGARREALLRECPELQRLWEEGKEVVDEDWEPDPVLVAWWRKQEEERKAANSESIERQRLQANAYRRRRRRLDPNYCRSRKERWRA